MRSGRLKLRAAVSEMFACAFLFAWRLEAAEPSSPVTATNELVQITGSVSATGSSTNLFFKTGGGVVYQLIRNDHAEALFADTNLHSRTLLVKGALLPEKKLELAGNLHSVKEGKVYELFYYCDICAIETSFPGPCLCCREPVVLTEREK